MNGVSLSQSEIAARNINFAVLALHRAYQHLNRKAVFQIFKLQPVQSRIRSDLDFGKRNGAVRKSVYFDGGKIFERRSDLFGCFVFGIDHHRQSQVALLEQLEIFGGAHPCDGVLCSELFGDEGTKYIQLVPRRTCHEQVGGVDSRLFQNVEVASNLYQHNIGAACGAWWAGWVNQCGAPNGYLVVDVDGDRLKWHYKATRRDFSYQFRLYNKGEFQSQVPFVVANVWDWDDACRIVWYQDGKPMGEMEQFVGADEERASQLKDRSAAVQTPHLFRALPADGARQVKVEWTNRFGETYTQTIDL